LKTEEILNEGVYEFKSQFSQTLLPSPGDKVKLTPEQQLALLEFQSFIQGQS
jgi:hypothetical protein